jgi:2-succinyl-6-hydroxy-2,4-cyclohexadiene-1-carboxylate synthase
VRVREDLVLLHGFAGTRRTWDGVLSHLPAERYRPLALDLPAHGSQAGADRPIDFDAAVESVLRRSPPRFALCGYSLGGRLALHVALAAPERVASLALVASGPGIEDPAERAERRAADRALADEIEDSSIDRFAERWCAQPMFLRDPAQVQALARADYLRNDPVDLAAVLRGLGQGEMASLWERLGELTLPVTAIAGERDAKLQAIARRMVGLLPDGRLEIVAGGHRLPLESPRAVAAVLLLPNG